jgi:hypothetical protein
MPAMTEAQVSTWVTDFLDALSNPTGGKKGDTGGVDWKKLEDMMNKRCTVELPGEPKCKKFDDFKKKAEEFLASFKGAKRTVPKGAKPIIVQSKKDEVEVIFPEQCLFTWSTGLAEHYPNCTLASGDKAKIFIYNRVLLNGKGECSYYQPVFSNNDFKGADRAEDTDSLLDQIYEDFTPGNARFADDMKVEFPVVGKMEKAGMFDLFAQFKGLKRQMQAGCPPVNMSTGKDEVFEGIVPCVYSFKWSAALNDTFKLELADGADVVLTSYDCLKLKSGKVISFAPHFDPSVNIKPAGKSGAA